MYSKEFFKKIVAIVNCSKLVIDRPKGSPHPKYSEMIYPYDYGYLDGTCSMDSGGIDIWKGSLNSNSVVGIICTIDTLKKDSEIKILIDCTNNEINDILKFHNKKWQSAIFIKNN